MYRIKIVYLFLFLPLSLWAQNPALDQDTLHDRLISSWSRDLSFTKNVATKTVRVLATGMSESRHGLDPDMARISGVNHRYFTSALLFRLPGDSAEYYMQVNDKTFDYKLFNTDVYEKLYPDPGFPMLLSFKIYRGKDKQGLPKDIWLIENFSLPD